MLPVETYHCNNIVPKASHQTCSTVNGGTVSHVHITIVYSPLTMAQHLHLVQHRAARPHCATASPSVLVAMNTLT